MHALDPTFATASIDLPAQQPAVRGAIGAPAASKAKKEKQEWELSRKKKREKTEKNVDDDNDNQLPPKKAKPFGGSCGCGLLTASYRRR